MAKRLRLPLRALPETLVHGHCHQKAVGAMKAMRRVLNLIPDHRFALIDAGCCGMAGTFGLEAEHADMAAAMAEQDLMPALRRAWWQTGSRVGSNCAHWVRPGRGTWHSCCARP